MALRPIGKAWRRFKSWLLAQLVGPYPELEDDQAETEATKKVVPFERRSDTGETDPPSNSSPER